MKVNRDPGIFDGYSTAIYTEADTDDSTWYGFEYTYMQSGSQSACYALNAYNICLNVSYSSITGTDPTVEYYLCINKSYEVYLGCNYSNKVYIYPMDGYGLLLWTRSYVRTILVDKITSLCICITDLNEANYVSVTGCRAVNSYEASLIYPN